MYRSTLTVLDIPMQTIIIKVETEMKNHVQARRPVIDPEDLSNPMSLGIIHTIMMTVETGTANRTQLRGPVMDPAYLSSRISLGITQIRTVMMLPALTRPPIQLRTHGQAASINQMFTIRTTALHALVLDQPTISTTAQLEPTQILGSRTLINQVRVNQVQAAQLLSILRNTAQVRLYP